MAQRDCLRTRGIWARCIVCGRYGEPCHVDLTQAHALFCEDHCPHCTGKPGEAAGQAVKGNHHPETGDAVARAVKAALGHPKAAGMSDHDIARHVGVVVQTVSKWRKQIISSVQNGQIQPDTITVTRAGKTYQQKLGGQAGKAGGEHEAAVIVGGQAARN